MEELYKVMDDLLDLEFYIKVGMDIMKELEELYQKYGFCLNTLHSYTFEGMSGFSKMQDIMRKFREGVTSFGGKKVLTCLDYIDGQDGLPKSDVLKYLLEDHSSVVIRPSGTEPKLKAYISVTADTKQQAEMLEKKIKEDLEKYLSV